MDVGSVDNARQSHVQPCQLFAPSGHLYSRQRRASSVLQSSLGRLLYASDDLLPLPSQGQYSSRLLCDLNFSLHVSRSVEGRQTSGPQVHFFVPRWSLTIHSLSNSSARSIAVAHSLLPRCRLILHCTTRSYGRFYIAVRTYSTILTYGPGTNAARHTDTPTLTFLSTTHARYTIQTLERPTPFFGETVWKAGFSYMARKKAPHPD